MLAIGCELPRCGAPAGAAAAARPTAEQGEAEVLGNIVILSTAGPRPLAMNDKARACTEPQLPPMIIIIMRRVQKLALNACCE